MTEAPTLNGLVKFWIGRLEDLTKNPGSKGGKRFDKSVCIIKNLRIEVFERFGQRLKPSL